MSTYTIAHTWDGEPIDGRESVALCLEQTPAGDWEIVIDAPYHDDLPPPAAAGQFRALWEHEVVEVFFAGANGLYLEVELGPHGHHLLQLLDAPRNIVSRELPLEYTATIREKRWTGRAVISTSVLPGGVARLNCFAIHGRDEHRRYLAWSPLPGSKPDFHQPNRFPPLPGC
jgi:hypothetical protein